MANYVAIARSNYFRVKRAEAFEAWCSKHSIEWWTDTNADMGTVYTIALPSTGDDGRGWNFVDPGDEDFDFAAELVAHLDPRDAVMLLEVGSEKLSYIIAYARVIRADGKEVFLDLQDEIKSRARDALGNNINITDPSY